MFFIPLTKEGVIYQESNRTRGGSESSTHKCGQEVIIDRKKK
jgi:hypothetical protein